MLKLCQFFRNKRILKKMKIINIYPKIAKYTLLALLCSLAILIVAFAICKNFENTEKFTSAVFLIIFALGIPAAQTFKFFHGAVETVSKENGVIDDPALKIKIAHLLENFNEEVRVGRYTSAEVNAFAISSLSGKKNLIAFSTGLLTIANDQELKAMAAHEIAHLKNGDSQNKTYILAFHEALRVYPEFLSKLGSQLLGMILILAIFIGVVLLTAVAVFQGSAYVFDISLKWIWMCLKLSMWPAAMIGFFYFLNYTLRRVWFSYSREREFVADADGAAMTSVPEMISALTLLSDPAPQMTSVFDTHPPLNERKNRLQNMTKV